MRNENFLLHSLIFNFKSIFPARFLAHIEIFISVHVNLFNGIAHNTCVPHMMCNNEVHRTWKLPFLMENFVLKVKRKANNFAIIFIFEHVLVPVENLQCKYTRSRKLLCYKYFCKDRSHITSQFRRW